MAFIEWIVVGLIAGWLAGKVMKGGGYGILIDIVLGMLGGILGGWIFTMLGIWPGGGIIGAILVAFVGAVILVWFTRIMKKA
ncbi:MAG TPA: GlsB/YeaQ/YmgE family stress response membrane protein [Terriglobia bacterium]|nr:GlsB/YeaQ/YmgE family stress response membrane protein [Terriglobia bacterium]